MKFTDQKKKESLLNIAIEKHTKEQELVLDEIFKKMPAKSRIKFFQSEALNEAVTPTDRGWNRGSQKFVYARNKGR